MRDGHTIADYGENILGGRAAIPQLLNLFEKHNIHAKWATVGFMFAHDNDSLKSYFPEELPSYKNEVLPPIPHTGMHRN